MKDNISKRLQEANNKIDAMADMIWEQAERNLKRQQRRQKIREMSERACDQNDEAFRRLTEEKRGEIDTQNDN